MIVSPSETVECGWGSPRPSRCDSGDQCLRVQRQPESAGVRPRAEKSHGCGHASRVAEPRHRRKRPTDPPVIPPTPRSATARLLRLKTGSVTRAETSSRAQRGSGEGSNRPTRDPEKRTESLARALAAIRLRPAGSLSRFAVGNCASAGNVSGDGYRSPLRRRASQRMGVHWTSTSSISSWWPSAWL